MSEEVQPLLNYDPRRTYDEKRLIQNVAFPFEDIETGRESTILIPEEVVKGKSSQEIRTLAEKTYDAFRRADEWIKSREREPREFTQKKAKVARDFYEGVVMVVAANCASIYVSRVNADTEEGRQEQEYLEEMFGENVDISKAIFESAKILNEIWLDDQEKFLEQFYQNLNSWVERHVIAAAIIEADEAAGDGATRESWGDVFWDRYKSQIEGTAGLHESYMQKEAQDILENDIKPVELSLEELRTYAGITWLKFLEEKKAKAREKTRFKREAIRPGGLLGLPVDHGAHSVTRYLAGKLEARIEVDGFRELPVIATRGQKRKVAVKEELNPEILSVIHPDSVKPALERIRNGRNELKAKTFVGALALAVQSDDPTRFFVRLEDLIQLITGQSKSGKKKLSSAAYWAKAAEVALYLTVDLACTQVNILVKLPQDKRALNVAEYLMHRPRLATEEQLLENDFMTKVAMNSSDGVTKELIDYLKSASLRGFFLGFPKEILDALGTRRGVGQPSALETISSDVLKLKGPAFWLAYEIAFLRRWAKPKDAIPDKGKNLFESLNNHGYCDKAERRSGDRISYKEALKAWLSDVEKLVDIGVLDAPGVSIFQVSKGQYQDATEAIKATLSKRGTRITQDSLCKMKVIYQIPERRIAELAGARAKRETLRAAGSRTSRAGDLEERGKFPTK